jgi:hypothetical protein
VHEYSEQARMEIQNKVPGMMRSFESILADKTLDQVSYVMEARSALRNAQVDIDEVKKEFGVEKQAFEEENKQELAKGREMMEKLEKENLYKKTMEQILNHPEKYPIWHMQVSDQIAKGRTGEIRLPTLEEVLKVASTNTTPLILAAQDAIKAKREGFWQGLGINEDTTGQVKESSARLRENMQKSQQDPTKDKLAELVKKEGKISEEQRRKHQGGEQQVNPGDDHNYGIQR